MTDAQDAREATLIYPGVCSLCLFFFFSISTRGEEEKTLETVDFKGKKFFFFSPSNLVTWGVCAPIEGV